MVFTAALPKLMEALNSKEPYEEPKTSKPSKPKKNGLTSLIWYIVNLALLAFALSLSYRRNGGFNLGSALVAFCCSPCYILYAYAVPVYNAPSV